MTPSLPGTLGELRASAWGKPPLAGRSVRDEIRANLLRALRTGEALFPGIQGYDDSIIPDLVHALLARQDFILLGLRGQAKSRILRNLTRFLDERLPIIAGSEVNDDPFAPISKYARDRITAEGDATPIAWVGRDDRFVEKLATPDVTIADLIGDLDPIRAARGGHVLSDELTMHFGLLPRANRGIFAINELPDLAGKIQVGLFNIMQEGDVQLKGYPVRLPLDVLLCFTANPEDYTARGKIITPLKDRIGAEIGTHYPREVETGMTITAQEAWTERGSGDGPPVRIPEIVREVVERVAFEARSDKRIDRRSGVSQRLPISTLENVVSSAERRAVLFGESEAVPSDLRHLRRAALDHRQAGAGVRGRAAGRGGDRPRADPAGRPPHPAGADRGGARRPAGRDRLLVRRGVGAQTERRRAGRDRGQGLRRGPRPAAAHP